MTQYQSGAAFRRALEERLRNRSIKTGIPLVRLRKTVAFDRFLARLIRHQPDSWVLKGGFAIQLRLVDKARTTKDIDVLVLAKLPEWSKPYHRLATEVSLGYQTLGEANIAFKAFLNPLLSEKGAREWDPDLWSWR